MTAREDLLAAAMFGYSRAEADAMLDAYAHELAEQQRTEMRAPGRSYDASRWNRCVDMVADLIDPAVTE